MTEEMERIIEEEEPTGSEPSTADEDVYIVEHDESASSVSSMCLPHTSPLQVFWDQLPYIDETDGEDNPSCLTSSEVKEDEGSDGRNQVLSAVTCNNSIGLFRSRAFPTYLVMSLSLIAVVTVCAMAPDLAKATLKVGVPADILIRKVRMYSEEPALSDFDISNSSLAIVSRLQLLDYSGCEKNLSACETFAVCDASPQLVTCRCKRGFFVEGRECKACSSRCPDGHYMTSQCSATRDVVCQPCKTCQGSQYEAAACTSTQDTICVDVSFPVGILPMNGSHMQDTGGTQISVSASGNVFMERLRDMKELEMTMYATNIQQSIVWHRESGMEIKLSISGVYLIPEYVDLDHVNDDNPFYLHSRNVTNAQKKTFKGVEENYCRDPLPDFYSLHLDITRHRTTVAETITCDSQNSSVPACPSGYNDGQTYLKRDINEACPKYQINRKKNLLVLEDLSNSVVCKDGTPLSLIFGMPNPYAEELTFPTSECEFSEEECQKCLKKNMCANDSADGTVLGECCNIDCYKHPTCTQAYSSTCPTAQAECATGEVYVFTLSPVFESMKNKFTCHLRYKKPAMLYSISYQVRIPSLGYDLEQRNFTVRNEDLEMHKEMASELDFLSVLHKTWLPLEEEMIVIGRHDMGEQIGELSLHPLKKHDEFFRRTYSVKRDYATRFSTLVQFDKPFRYSSLSWNKDHCEKNLSKVFPNQTLYKADSVRVSAKVMKRHGQIHYHMYRNDRTPFIRLGINQSQSILSTFQTDMTESRIDSSRTQVDISWHRKEESWTIHFSGALTACPGIISFEVFDKLMTKCLGHYDTFIDCPENFTILFNISKSKAPVSDILVLYANDSVTSHRFILSSVIVPEVMPVTQSVAMEISSQTDTTSSPWIPVVVIVSLTGFLFIVFFVVYLCIHARSPQYHDNLMEKTESLLLNNHECDKMMQKYSKPASSKPASRVVLFSFIILYVIYCVVFTFSVAFGILYFSHLTVLSKFTHISNLTVKLQKEVNYSLHLMKSFEEGEIKHLTELFRSRQHACIHHLNTDNRRVLHQIAHITRHQLEVVYVQNGSLQYNAEKTVREDAAKQIIMIQSFIQDCNQTVQTYFKTFSENYYSYLENIGENRWFDFPREMFFRQIGKDETSKEFSLLQLIKFMSWLQVDQADRLLSVDKTVSDRLLHTAPTLSSVFSIKNLDSFQFTDVPAVTVENKRPQKYKYILLPKTENSTSRETTRLSEREKTLNTNSSMSSSENGSISTYNFEMMMYILIAVFLIMDVLLWVFRITWLYREIQKARYGFEEKLPSDETARKVLKIQKGKHPPRPFDPLEHPYNYYVQNKDDNWNSDNELYVYFCQSYPKSKEDILREIWAHKMNQRPKSSTEKLQEFWVVLFLSFFWWIHRAFLSKLLWRFTYTAAIVIFVCSLVYVLENWLDQKNFEVFVGADLLVSELKWQASVINDHLLGMRNNMNSFLRTIKMSVDTDVDMMNNLFFHTLQRQTGMLSSVLSAICTNVTSISCDLSGLDFQMPSFLSSCSFLPITPQLYSELDLNRIQGLMTAELAPLMHLARCLVFMTSYVIISLVCARILCHAVALVIKDYLFVSRRLPQITIYQISTSGPMYPDGVDDDPKEIHRSASWLESCESGVYVGDVDDSAREATT